MKKVEDVRGIWSKTEGAALILIISIIDQDFIFWWWWSSHRRKWCLILLLLLIRICETHERNKWNAVSLFWLPYKVTKIACFRNQHWTSSCRCNRSKETSIWYLGQYSKCGKSYGFYWITKPYTGKLTIIFNTFPFRQPACTSSTIDFIVYSLP
jgi:hypothetical protein